MDNQQNDSPPPAPTTTALVPVPPKGLVAEEDDKLKKQSDELIDKLGSNLNDRGQIRELTNIGAEAQRETGQKMELLRGRVGTLLSQLDGDGARVPNDMIALRSKLDEINPHALSKPSGLLRKVPKVGKMLQQIALKYETVQSQIDAIVNSLREGKDMLDRDNFELEQLYDSVQEQQFKVIKNAYLGELILQRLEEAQKSNQDPTERQRLQEITHDVAMRVQDLRTMEQVNLQFFVSLDLTIQNNHRLGQAVSRTLTVTTSLVTVGIAIQAALSRQKKVMEATQETQRYASDMLAANAASIRQQTSEIADLHNNPVLALDKVREAYDDLTAALDETERIKQEGIESAKKGIAELSEMSSALQPRVEGIRNARDSQESLEA